MQHFREIGSLFFVWPGNMDQCSWRCKVRAHHVVPVSISQLKTKMNATAVVTYLTSQAFKWCMTLSLYIGSFLVLSHTVLLVCSVCIWGCSLSESNDSVNVHHDWQPVYQTYFASLRSDCGGELCRECILQILREVHWLQLWTQKFLVGLRAVFCTWLPQNPTQSAP